MSAPKSVYEAGLEWYTQKPNWIYMSGASGGEGGDSAPSWYDPVTGYSSATDPTGQQGYYGVDHNEGTASQVWKLGENPVLLKRQEALAAYDAAPGDLNDKLMAAAATGIGAAGVLGLVQEGAIPITEQEFWSSGMGIAFDTALRDTDEGHNAIKHLTQAGLAGVGAYGLSLAAPALTGGATAGAELGVAGTEIGAGAFGGAELGAGSLGGSTLTGAGVTGAGTAGSLVGDAGSYFGGADVAADPLANLGGMGGYPDGSIVGGGTGGTVPGATMPGAVVDAGAIGGMGSTAGGLGSLLTNPSVVGAGLGALAGGLGGTEAGTVNTTNTSQLPAWQLPYVQFGLDEAKKWYEGLGGMNNINLDTAIDEYNKTMSGAYLDPATNPWLTATYNMAADQVGAGVDSRFSGAGRYGSGAHQGVLGQQLGNLATNIYGGNYQLERDKQWGATQGAPAWNAGVTTASAAPLSIYQGLVSGNYGGTQYGQTPYFNNPVGNLIGGAMLGGTFGKMFGG